MAVLDIAIAAQHDGAGPLQLPGLAGERRIGPGQQHVAEHRAGDGQQHLRQAEAEHQAAHALQLGQVELQPDHEHQEHHAELGRYCTPAESLASAVAFGPISAHHQVAQHGRQPREPARDHAGDGGHQVEQDEFERGGHEADEGMRRC
jgi:hypothetical protein